MIRLTLHLWSKLSDPRCSKERQRRASFFIQWIISRRSVSSRSNAGYIMMHDVNIEEETKCETLVFLVTLLWFTDELDRSLSMIRLTLHLWSRLSDPRCSEERQRKASFFIQQITSPSISVEPIKCWLHHNAWYKHWRRRNKVWNFRFSLVTLL